MVIWIPTDIRQLDSASKLQLAEGSVDGAWYSTEKVNHAIWIAKQEIEDDGTLDDKGQASKKLLDHILAEGVGPSLRQAVKKGDSHRSNTNEGRLAPTNVDRLDELLWIVRCMKACGRTMSFFGRNGRKLYTGKYIYEDEEVSWFILPKVAEEVIVLDDSESDGKPHVLEDVRSRYENWRKIKWSYGKSLSGEMSLENALGC